MSFHAARAFSTPSLLLEEADDDEMRARMQLIQEYSSPVAQSPTIARTSGHNMHENYTNSPIHDLTASSPSPPGRRTRTFRQHPHAARQSNTSGAARILRQESPGLFVESDRESPGPVQANHSSSAASIRNSRRGNRDIDDEFIDIVAASQGFISPPSAHQPSSSCLPAAPSRTNTDLSASSTGESLVTPEISQNTADTSFSEDDEMPAQIRPASARQSKRSRFITSKDTEQPLTTRQRIARSSSFDPLFDSPRPGKKPRLEDELIPDLPTVDLTDANEVPEDLHEPLVDNRIKLKAFQCVICMDNVTSLTVTHCGKLTKTKLTLCGR